MKKALARAGATIVMAAIPVVAVSTSANAYVKVSTHYEHKPAEYPTQANCEYYFYKNIETITKAGGHVISQTSFGGASPCYRLNRMGSSNTNPPKSYYQYDTIKYDGVMGPAIAGDQRVFDGVTGPKCTPGAACPM